MRTPIFKFDLTMNLGNVWKKIGHEVHSARLAVTGPSGSGKTSFAQALAGTNHDVKGQIFFRGEDLSGVPAWKRRFGYVPQDHLLLPHLSVEDNLLFPKQGKLVPEILDGLGIHHLLKRMPRNLSGGEKQRVALARALSSAPRLLILDEPFSSLDSKIKKNIVPFIDDFTKRNELPLVLISHYEEDLCSLTLERISLEDH